MRWDDLQLLRWIDELEQTNAYIGNGQNLLQQVARLAGVPWHDDMAGFAVELELAHGAGYLTWTDRSSHYVGLSSPTADPNQWLQTVDNIKLTLVGREQGARPGHPNRTARPRRG